MAEDTAFPLLQRLQAILTEDLPYCCGVVELPQNNFNLYYGKEDARFIDLSKSHNDGALEALAQACKPAKFGRREDTVPDDTYCKTMDPEEFITRFDVEGSSLLDTIRLGLLSKDDKKRVVHAELRKLNVSVGHSDSAGAGGPHAPMMSPLTPGEDLKLHGAAPGTGKDTPRSPSRAFGSLVVVFPTAHSGCALLLRHADKEFTFDGAALLSGLRTSVAYIAFASTIELKLNPILSGHRVYLTYDLSYVERESRLARRAPPASSIEVLQPAHANASALTAALGALFADATFMSHGGTLGFGLRHRDAYALPKLWARDMGIEDPLNTMRVWLAGSDAALCAACTALGVPARLRLVYRVPGPGNKDGDGDAIALDHTEDLGDGVECARGALLARGGVRLLSYAFTGDAAEPWVPSVLGRKRERARTCECDCGDDLERLATVVHWVTEAGEADGPRSAYATWGDEAALYWLRTSACMLVEIDPYGDRSKKVESMGDVDEDMSDAYVDEGEDADDDEPGSETEE